MRSLKLQIVSWLLICLANESIATNTLNQGDIFNSSSRLNSTNGFFTLGFSGQYLVINNTIDELNHPVWSANRDNPISEGTAALTIDEFGSLKITHRGGDPFVIYAGGDPFVIYSGDSKSAASGVTAVLEDNGNFLLKQQGNIVWESFDHPTDSLLPGMKLGIDRRRGKMWKLTAWLSDNNSTSGPLTLEWIPEERQAVIKLREDRLWTSGELTPDPIFENKFEYIYQDESRNYVIKHVSNENEDYITYSLLVDESSPPENILRWNISRWFFDYRGELKDGLLRPFIACFENCCDGNSTEFGCQKWVSPMTCRRNGDRFLYTGGNFHFKNIRREKDLNFVECKDKCWKWKDCNCSAFNYVDDHEEYRCEFYTGPYGGEVLVPGGGDVYRHEMYVIVQAPPPASASKKWRCIVTTVIVVPTAILAAMFWYLRWRKLKQEEKFMKELLTWDMPEYEGDEVEDGRDRNQTLNVYSVASIKSATNSFSSENKLGEGGFGPVYKGRLPEGAEIAVKRLSARSGQGLVEFKNELLFIAKLQHMNLVRLLGFCIQGEERLLVYEYLPNKSLDFYIFGDESRRQILDWNKRFNIIEGIAQGLLYLHKYSRLRIIHRDMKASNVLLDKDMNPKISDFGMARIFRANESEANTNRIVGTYGYMSPEYAMSGISSVKSDVYSFGVLLLEIVSGKKNHNVYDYDRMLNFIGYAWELWKEDNALELTDPAIRHTAAKDQVLRCINVGLLCVEQSPIERPSMSSVLSMLTSEVQVALPMPKQPAFCGGKTVPMSISSILKETQSANGMSMTQMDGR